MIYPYLGFKIRYKRPCKFAKFSMCCWSCDVCNERGCSNSSWVDAKNGNVEMVDCKFCDIAEKGCYEI